MKLLAVFAFLFLLFGCAHKIKLSSSAYISLVMKERKKCAEVCSPEVPANRCIKKCLVKLESHIKEIDPESARIFFNLDHEMKTTLSSELESARMKSDFYIKNETEGRQFLSPGWERNIGTDPLTDKKDVQVTLYSKYEKNKERFFFTMQCYNNRTYVYFYSGTVLTGNRKGLTKVTSRVDKRPAETSLWRVDKDYTTIRPPGKPIRFIKSLIGANELLVSAEDWRHRAVFTRFKVRDIGKYIYSIRKHCHW